MESNSERLKGEKKIQGPTASFIEGAILRVTLKKEELRFYLCKMEEEKKKQREFSVQ